MPTPSLVPLLYRGALLLLHQSIPVGEAPVALLPVVSEALPLLHHEIERPHQGAVNGSIILYIRDVPQQAFDCG